MHHVPSGHSLRQEANDPLYLSTKQLGAFSMVPTGIVSKVINSSFPGCHVTSRVTIYVLASCTDNITLGIKVLGSPERQYRKFLI